MGTRIDVTDVSLGIGVLEFGNYDVNDVFQGYQDVGAIKGTWSMQVTRETRSFEAGQPLLEVKSQVLRETVRISFQMSEFRVANLKFAFGGGIITDSVAPTFLDGTNVAPTGDLTDSATAVVSANRWTLGGECDLDRVGLRFTHIKSCGDGKRQIVEVFFARTSGDITLPFNEEDWNLWTVEFMAIADTTRAAGAQYFQVLDEN